MISSGNVAASNSRAEPLKIRVQGTGTVQSNVRRLFGILLFPILLGAAGPLKIDHVTVAGRDLKKIVAALEAIGIPSEYGGPHSNHATEMALTSFPDGSYLELIAPQPNADPKALAAHAWSKQIMGDAGPCAWAVQSTDVDAEIKRLREAGISVKAATRSGRNRPDGKRLDWEVAQVGEEPNGTFFPFVIRDFTPRRERAFPSGKPTTKDFSGVTRVVIAVRDMDASVKRYQQAYGLPAPVGQADPAFGARLSLFTGTPVVLAAPLNGQSWLAARLEKMGEGPCAFILGARKAGRYKDKTAVKTNWSMADISWFDPEKLGWNLGFE
jgi:hypothetical protein